MIKIETKMIDGNFSVKLKNECDIQEYMALITYLIENLSEQLGITKKSIIKTLKHNGIILENLKEIKND